MKKFDKFFDGKELEAYKIFGSHPLKNGVEFCLYAPNAYKIEVNINNNKKYQMNKIDERGIWYVFVDNLIFKGNYEYNVWINKNDYVVKTDPYGFVFKKDTSHATILYDYDCYKFSDSNFISKRNVGYDKAINIYELHMNCFKKNNKTRYTTYNSVKNNLIKYLKDNFYNYVEFMPLFEYPFDGSWGYQATGFFAPTSRYGKPEDLKDLINELHKNNIGVILDVPFSHFANDSFGLYKFDGKSCYEYDKKTLTKNEWGSCYFDLTKQPVVSFLMSSAYFFLKEYHFDGLRFDAVSHFIYRKGEEKKGINEEGISFLKTINANLKERLPKCMLIAEDSSNFYGVTKPIKEDGLGFDYKWDLGWMNDTLEYYSLSTSSKHINHNLITFSMSYFNNEKFILPFSHDEVVHSKKTIIDKMYGDYEVKFKLCRNLFMYMYTHPGKKLNFEGNEIAMFREFDENRELDWSLLKYQTHNSFNKYINDLNRIYLKNPVLYEEDYNPEKFKWIDPENYSQSIYSYYRYNSKYCFVVILNMTEKKYEDFRIGVPFDGKYIELINSDDKKYGGSDFSNKSNIESEKKSSHGFKNSIKIIIAPYSSMIFKVKVKKEEAKDYFNPDFYKKGFDNYLYNSFKNK